MPPQQQDHSSRWGILFELGPLLHTEGSNFDTFHPISHYISTLTQILIGFGHNLHQFSNRKTPPLLKITQYFPPLWFFRPGTHTDARGNVVAYYDHIRHHQSCAVRLVARSRKLSTTTESPGGKLVHHDAARVAQFTFDGHFYQGPHRCSNVHLVYTLPVEHRR